jgi:hypothetical protein
VELGSFILAVAVIGAIRRRSWLPRPLARGVEFGTSIFAVVVIFGGVTGCGLALDVALGTSILALAVLWVLRRQPARPAPTGATSPTACFAQTGATRANRRDPRPQALSWMLYPALRMGTFALAWRPSRPFVYDRQSRSVAGRLNPS